MHTPLRLLFPLFTAAGLLMACGSDAALPGINPSLVISSPANNSSVNLPSNKQIAIGFNTNYSLATPGQCTVDNCGHVYILVDNSGCNLANQPYNHLAISSPTFADFSHCTTPTGMHTITLALRHNDGTPVLNLVGSPVTQDVTVTVQ